MTVMIAIRDYIGCTVTALVLIFVGGCATLPDAGDFAHRAPVADRWYRLPPSADPGLRLREPLAHMFSHLI